ncbi:MAG: hypothetical protein ACREX6_02370, partial [Casimicrobiaceae bacterium]
MTRRRVPVAALLAQPKRIALLACIALEGREGGVRRDTVTALFWPDSNAARARGALRQSIHFIRGILGDDVLRSDGDVS